METDMECYRKLTLSQKCIPAQEYPGPEQQEEASSTNRGRDKPVSAVVSLPGFRPCLLKDEGSPPRQKALWAQSHEAHYGKETLLQEKIRGGWVTESCVPGPCYLLYYFPKHTQPSQKENERVHLWGPIAQGKGPKDAGLVTVLLHG